MCAVSDINVLTYKVFDDKFFLKYIHTHVYVHINIYIYIYKPKCVYIYI